MSALLEKLFQIQRVDNEKLNSIKIRIVNYKRYGEIVYHKNIGNDMANV